MRRRLVACAVGTMVLFGPAAAAAPAQERSPWTFTTRLVLSGSSDAAESDPQGYKVYSGIALDAGIQRRLGSRFVVDLNVRTESREITLRRAQGGEAPLGSVEALPVTLVLQYRPFAGEKIRPYFGAGLNLTVVWEKAGALDSTDLSPSIAPAVQLGTDVRLSPRVFLNLDVKWNPWRTEIKERGDTLAHLRVDPIAVGAGVGFRF